MSWASRFLLFAAWLGAAFAVSVPARAEEDEVAVWIDRLRRTRGSDSLSSIAKQEILVGGIEALKRVVKREKAPAIAAYRKKLAEARAAKGETAEVSEDDALRRLLFDETPDAKALRAGLVTCRNPSDASTCGLRDLYSETNFLAAAVIAEGQFARCDDDLSANWIRQQGLTQSVLAAQGRFRPHCEGAGSRKSYQVLQEIPAKPGDEAKMTGWPLMYAGDQLGRLLNQSDAIIRKSYVDAPATYLGKKFPPRSATKLTEEEYAAVKMNEEMKEAIYDRAVTNALKTRLAFQRFFGQKSYGEISAEIRDSVRAACRHCDEDTRRTTEKRALNSVYRSVPQERSDFFRDPRNVVMKLCQDLGKAGYYGTGYRPELAQLEAADFAEAERKSLRNQPVQTVDPAELKRAMAETLARENAPPELRAEERRRAQAANSLAKRRALSGLVLQGDQGLLMLTDAMTAKDDAGNAQRIRLNCESSEKEVQADVELVKSALKEADGKLQGYLDKINRETQPLRNFGKPELDRQNEQLRALIKDNAIAAGEALAENPLSTGVVCHALNGIYREELRDGENKMLLQAALLTANVATLGIASVPTAIIGGLVLTGVGVFDKVVVQGGKVSAEQKEVLNALYAGQSGNDELRGRQAELLQEYEELRFAWSDGFDIAMSSVEGLNLFRALAKTIKTPTEMVEATRILRERKAAGSIRNLTPAQLETEILAVHRGLLGDAKPLLSPAEWVRLRAKYPDLSPAVLEEYAQVRYLGEAVLGEGRVLTDFEADLLFDAHRIGQGKSYGFYTKTELLQKRRLLEKAGFQPKEIEKLIVNGVAGSARAEVPVGELAKTYQKAMTNDRLIELGKQAPTDVQGMLAAMRDDYIRLKACREIECIRAARILAKDYDELRSVTYFSQKTDEAKRTFSQSTPKFSDLDLTGGAGKTVGGPTNDAGKAIGEIQPAKVAEDAIPAKPVVPKTIASKPVPPGYNVGQQIDIQIYRTAPGNYVELHRELADVQAAAARVTTAENPASLAARQREMTRELRKIAESKKDLEKSVAQFDELAQYEGSIDPEDLANYAKAKELNRSRTDILTDLRTREKILIEEQKRIGGLQAQWRRGFLEEPARFVNDLPPDADGRLIASVQQAVADAPSIPADKLDRYLHSVETALATGGQTIVGGSDQRELAEGLLALVKREDVDIRYFPDIRKRIEKELGKLEWKIPPGSKYNVPPTVDRGRARIMPMPVPALLASAKASADPRLREFGKAVGELRDKFAKKFRDRRQTGETFEPGYFRTKEYGYESGVSHEELVTKVFGDRPVDFKADGIKLTIAPKELREGARVPVVRYDVSGNYFRLQEGVVKNGKIVLPSSDPNLTYGFRTSDGKLFRPMRPGESRETYLVEYFQATHFAVTK